MKITNAAFIMISAIFLSIPAHAQDLSHDVAVADAWVQAVPPVQSTTAAYMTIYNNSSKAVVITVSVPGNVADSAEIHQMSDMKGMMHMAVTASIQISGKARLELAPGGFHIMLIDLKKSIKAGDDIPITLHFQDGSTMTVEAAVKKMDDPGSMPGMRM